jgi:hypothetical protein
MSHIVVKTSILLVIMLFCCAVLLSETVAEPPPNYHEPDAGTENNPFLISNLANLRWLSESTQYWGWLNSMNMGYNDYYYFLQTADIDATETTSWNDGNGFRPIGCHIRLTAINHPLFMGQYDGAGYQIRNLFIHKSAPSSISLLTFDIGLFGSTINATIKDVHIVDIDFTYTYVTSNTGNFFAGGLAGSTLHTDIMRCSVSGTINASPQENFSGFIGGLIGSATYSTIEQSYSTVSILDQIMADAPNLSSSVGGLVGRSSSSKIHNSYFSGGISTSQDRVQAGGLVGFTTNNTDIQKCYVVGSFVNVHSLIGRIMGATLMAGNLWDSQATPIDRVYNQIDGNSHRLSQNHGLNTQSMKSPLTFGSYGWNFNSIWAISVSKNDGYPHLRNCWVTDGTSESDSEHILVRVTSHSAYPNPVKNAFVTFSVSQGSHRSKDAQFSISVYNVKGQRIMHSRDFMSRDDVNTFTWDRKNYYGQYVPSGIYFYQINVGYERYAGKLLVLQ